MFEAMKILKVLSRAREDAKRIEEDLKQLHVEGASGGGVVRVRMNGKLDLLDCTIDSQVFADHDAELLADLLVAAVNQAAAKTRKAIEERVSSMSSSANIMDELQKAFGQAADGPQNPGTTSSS